MHSQVYDAVRNAVVEITKSMIEYVRWARSCYVDALENKKAEAASVERQNSAMRHAESELRQLLDNKEKHKETTAVENAVNNSKIAELRKTAGLPGVLKVFFFKLPWDVLKIANVQSCPDKFECIRMHQIEYRCSKISRGWYREPLFGRKGGEHTWK